MTLGLSVLIGLFLLSPGLAVHSALFGAGNPRGIRFAPPPPGSVSAISVIGLGALVAHAFWGTLVSANDFLGPTFPLLSVPFEPNIYTTMLRANAHTQPISGADIAAVLVSLTVLSLLAYITTRNLLLWPPLGRRLQPLRYGWLTDFVELVGPENRYATAFVLSSVEHDGSFLGYEGLIEHMALDADKEITSILLVDVNRFVVQLGPRGLTRRVIDREPISRLFVDRLNIRNVALTVFEDSNSPS